MTTESADQREGGVGRALAEGRLNEEVESLRTHTARGSLINATYLLALNGLVLLKGLVGAAYLTPREFGIWGLLSLALLSVLWLREVGINQRYIQQSEADQELEMKRAFTLSIGFMSTCALGMVAIIVAFTQLYDSPELLVPGLVLSTSLIAAGLQFPAWAFYRRMDYVRQRLTQGVEPVVGLVVTLGLLIAGADYWALVIGATAGTWMGAAVALIVSPYPLGIELSRSTLSRYLQFAWPLFIAVGSTVVIVQITYFAGGQVLGVAGVGVIALVGQLMTFTHKADAVLTQTLYPAICAMKDQPVLLLESLVKSNRLALVWGMPFGVGLALFADDLVQFVLGDEWSGAVTYLQLMALAAALHHVAFNWNAYYQARAETKPLAAASMIALAMFVVLPLPLLVFGGLDAFGVGMLIFSAGSMIVRGIFVRRLFPNFRMGIQLGRALAVAAPPAVIVLAARTILGLDRSPGLALGELASFLALTVLSAVIVERRLLREAIGYVRGRAANPLASSTTAPAVRSSALS